MGNSYGPVIADENGQWQIPVADELPDGTATFIATATDASGNEVTDSFTLEVDASPASMPVISSVEDDVWEHSGKSVGWRSY